jgi:hypothetical protein
MMMGLSLLASACVLDEGDDSDVLGTTEQEIDGWISGGFSSTTSLGGWDTGKHKSNATCVLSQLAGDLSKGDFWDFATDVPSGAGIREMASGNWQVFAHGGANTDQNGDRDWIGNVATGSAVCVNHPKVALSNNIWVSSDGPRRLGAALTNRRCFLQSVHAGSALFQQTDDFVRVKKYTTTDATHPTTGWYLEGNLGTNSHTGAKASATAVCIDFPAGSMDHDWDSGLAVPGTTTLTSGSGIKMCGLTTVMGPFNVNTWNHGVVINPPILPDGQWTMTVSSGKRARAMCIR